MIDIKKKPADLVKIALLGGRGSEFSSFINDEKRGRGGSQSNISLLHRTVL